MISAGISDKGKVRENNEDRYLIWESHPLYLFAVADGMGGHAAGEVASALALETIRQYLSSGQRDILDCTEPDERGRHLQKIMTLANQAIWAEGTSRRVSNGMGTTLTAAMIINGVCWLGHVGDSRSYLLDEAGIVRLTQDHTLVTQLLENGRISRDDLQGHPQRHILTKALGTEENVDFDLIRTDVASGQKILLCSDGLYCMVTDEEILEIVQAGDDPQTVVKILTDLANERGGTDNITAVLVFI